MKGQRSRSRAERVVAVAAVVVRAIQGRVSITRGEVRCQHGAVGSDSTLTTPFTSTPFIWPFSFTVFF